MSYVKEFTVLNFSCFDANRVKTKTDPVLSAPKVFGPEETSLIVTNWFSLHLICQVQTSLILLI